MDLQNSEAGERAPLDQLIEDLKARVEKAGWGHSYGSLHVVYVNDVLDWLDELEAALTSLRASRPATLDAIKKLIEGKDYGTTHWSGCEASHPRCAIRVLLAEVEHLQAVGASRPVGEGQQCVNGHVFNSTDCSYKGGEWDWR